MTKKKKDKEDLKKRRRSQSNLTRKEPSKLEIPTILIVCEGKNTEPSYFRHFKLSTVAIEVIGEGCNTVSLVNRAIELKNGYDKVWCVFDKDDFDNGQFNNAIQKAENNNFGVAYSNQAFEYWLILHFEDHQGARMSRKKYPAKINNLLKKFGLSYDKKSKEITEDFFHLLNGTDDKTNKRRRDLAIERAKRNHDNFDHNNDALKESSTTVFRLVEELIKYE